MVMAQRTCLSTLMNFPRNSGYPHSISYQGTKKQQFALQVQIPRVTGATTSHGVRSSLPRITHTAEVLLASNCFLLLCHVTNGVLQTELLLPKSRSSPG